MTNGGVLEKECLEELLFAHSLDVRLDARDRVTDVLQVDRVFTRRARR